MHSLGLYNFITRLTWSDGLTLIVTITLSRFLITVWVPERKPQLMNIWPNVFQIQWTVWSLTHNMPNASGTENESEAEHVVNSCKILFELLIQCHYGSIMRKTAAAEVKRSCSLNTCGTIYDARPLQCLTSLSRSRGWWSTCKNQETPH